MRILIIGHSYVTGYAQQKLEELTQTRGISEVTCLVPEFTSHLFGEYPAIGGNTQKSYELIALRRRGQKTGLAWWFKIGELMTLFYALRPDIILVEEDPYSAVGIEVALLSQLCVSPPMYGFFIWDNLFRRYPLHRWMAKVVLQLVSSTRAGFFVCGNREAMSILREEKAFHGPTYVIPQIGVTVGEVATGSRDLANDLLTIGFVGRIVEEKGIAILIGALSLTEDLPWRFLVVGSGPMESIIRKWVKDSGFDDRVVLVPPVPHAEVTKILGGIDIFILPSISKLWWKEQFGLTLAQAMVSGCVCIGSDSGAIPDVLGETGYLFKEGSASALAGTLRHIFGHRSEAASYARSSLIRGRERYSMKSIAHDYAFLFNAVHPTWIGKVI